MFKRIYPLIIFFNLITALAWAAPDGVNQNLSVNSTTELAELDTGGGTTWEELEDGDICWVISATGLSVRIYIYDSDSAQTEDGERYVTPDESSTGVAYSGDARWVCMSTAQAGSDGDYFLELGNNSSIDPDASKYQVYFDAGELKVNENGTEKYIANLTDAQTFAGAITFGSTVSGSAGSMTVTATGFDGNLETTDDTLQEIAQKLDDLTTGGSTDPDALDGDVVDDNLIDQSIVAGFAATASPNFIFGDSDNLGADKECARIEANATTTTDGAEDADLIFSVMQGGTVTPVLTFDESDDQWETTKAMTFAGGAITGATTFSGAGEINLPSSDASPDVAGEIRHDSTVTGLATGALAWYDGDEVRYIVDLDVLPSNDDYVVAYDADNDVFYMKQDSTGAGSLSLAGDGAPDGQIQYAADANDALAGEDAFYYEADTNTLYTDNLILNGPITLLQSDDPDVDATGEMALDTDGWLRVYQNSLQKAVPLTQEIHVTVVAPNDLADATRDAFQVWQNVSGMSFVVTGWKASSAADDTTLNIEETDNDGANNATVDAVEIATNGTGLYYASDATITAATIEDGHRIWLDFDDTDTPGWVEVTIYGYYLGDVN